MDDLVKRIRLAHTVLLITCGILFYSLDPNTQAFPTGYQTLIGLRSELSHLNSEAFIKEVGSQYVGGDADRPSLRFGKAPNFLEKPDDERSIHEELDSITSAKSGPLYHVQAVEGLSSETYLRDLIAATQKPIPVTLYVVPDKIGGLAASLKHDHNALLAAYNKQQAARWGITTLVDMAGPKQKVVGRSLFGQLSAVWGSRNNLYPLTDDEEQAVAERGVYALSGVAVEFSKGKTPWNASRTPRFGVTLTMLNPLAKASLPDPQERAGALDVLRGLRESNGMRRPVLPKNGFGFGTNSDEIAYVAVPTDPAALAPKEYYYSTKSAYYPAVSHRHLYEGLTAYHSGLKSVDVRLMDFTLDEAIAALSRHIAGNLGEDELEILGFRIKKRHAGIIVPVLLTFLLAYLFVAITEMRRREHETPGSIAQCQTSWVGVFPSRIARLAMIFTLAVIPMSIVGYLFRVNGGHFEWPQFVLFGCVGCSGLAAGVQLARCYAVETRTAVSTGA